MKIPNGKQHKLSIKLAVIIFCVTLLWSFIGSGILVYISYQEQLDNINENIAELGTTSSGSLAKGIWVLNHDLVKAQLEGIARMPYIAQATVHNSDGSSYIAGIKSLDDIDPMEFPLIFKDRVDDIRLGNLSLYPDYSYLEANLKSIAVKILISLPIGAFTLGFVVFLIVYLFSGRYIERASFLASKVSLENIDSEIIIKKKDHNRYVKDEIDILQDALNSMRTSIKDSIEDLKASEDRYRRLAENSPDMIYRMSLPDGIYEYVSPASEMIFGYPPNVWYDNPGLIVNAIHPDFQLYFKEKWKLLLGGELSPTYEYQIVYKEENTRWIHQRNVGVYNKKKRLIAIEGVATDITDRKNSEKALQDSHKRFITVLNSIDATIYVTDMKTYKILFMNKHMVDSFGRDMTGEICWKAFRGESKPCVHCTNDKLIDRNNVPTGVVVWNDKNPINEKWYINHDRAIKWTDGRLVRIQIATDITNLKKMEGQLRQSQKMESIGTLAGGIAHDFNNILFPIVGHTEMLIEDIPEDSPFRASLNEIYTGALRARELVKQILTFSRQESSELKLMKMQPIIKEALKLIRSTIPTTIAIKQDISPACGIIKADPIQIHQIVMNLCTNAYHAMEDTGGELKVSLNELELSALDLINPDMATGVYACLTVADTGKGMDKKLTQKIFDPFFTTKEKDKGTGMGLSVVHGIVTSMNGTIQVYSEPGKGTVFNVYLSVEKSSSTESITNSNVKLQTGTEQILLVDDEDAIITMEKLMLERLGYQVTSRTSSIEALEVFRDSPDKFNLVITDMAMPNIPGDTLSAELTKIRPDIPILLCTGFSEAMSEEKSESLGIKGFLLKPIVMKDLSKKIREVLDENKV